MGDYCSNSDRVISFIGLQDCQGLFSRSKMTNDFSRVIEVFEVELDPEQLTKYDSESSAKTRPRVKIRPGVTWWNYENSENYSSQSNHQSET